MKNRKKKKPRPAPIDKQEMSSNKPMDITILDWFEH